MIEVRLPQFGMGMTDGAVTGWLKAVGETVAAGEILCEVETAKSTVEIEAPCGGRVVRILAPVGERIEAHAVIAMIEEGTRSASAPSVTTAHDPADGAPSGTLAASAQGREIAEVQIEPRARRAAKELGVALEQVVGTGPAGRILERDVVAMARRLASPVERTEPVEDLSLRPGSYVTHDMARRTIAHRLVQAKRDIPHFYLKASCRIDELLTLRQQANAALGERDHLSVNDVVLCAVARAMSAVPEVNVSWGEEAMRRHQVVDIGFAVASATGILVPVIRDADQKKLRDIAAEARELAVRARAGKLRPEEYQGGGAAVSNLGMYGVEEFAAIINPPQSMMFAIGAGQERPIVENGGIVPATMMTCVVSVDHRAIDGAVAARVLAAFKALIETPQQLFL